MPELSLAETISVSFGAQEPWPDNVKLFQPYEVEQILLPDNASCLAVQAFLKMCNLPFEVEMRWNAEFMSPSGRVPFIKCGAFVVAELESIVQFCGNKGAGLCQRLGTEERAEMRAYMSLVSNVLLNAELYVSWLERETYETVTRPRNSSVYPWPLGWLQTRAKRTAVAKRLNALHWQDKTLEQVLNDVEHCCSALSQRLGDKEYFFGTPTPLDALIYGHIRALLSAVGPKAHLMIRPITSVLLRHTVRVANLTFMKLKPQEDYLISQALVISQRLRAPPTPDRGSQRTCHSDRSVRARRQRNASRAHNGDSIAQANSLFGFKPFTAKKVLVMSSEEDNIQCDTEQNPNLTKCLENWENINVDKDTLVGGIIDEVLDRIADSVLVELDTTYAEKNDFEVIVECSEAYEASVKHESGNQSRVTNYNDRKAEQVTDTSKMNKASADYIKTNKLNELEVDEAIAHYKESVQARGETILESHHDISDMYDGDGVVIERHLESASGTGFNVSELTISPNLSATLAAIALGNSKNEIFLSDESPLLASSYESLFEQAHDGSDQRQYLEDTNVHQWIQSQFDDEFGYDLPEDNID